MPRLTFLVLVALLFAGCGKEDGAPKSRYAPGQAWAYATRPGEEGSRVLILKIERRGRYGIVVHVAVDGLRIANPRGGTPEEREVTVIAHIPITEAALDASVTEMLLEETAVPPDWERGYERWLGGFRERKASIWEKPLVEEIETIAKGLLKP